MLICFVWSEKVFQILDAWYRWRHLLVVKTIFYSFASLIRKILFTPVLEDKIHILAPPCNILYIPLPKMLSYRVTSVVALFTYQTNLNISCKKAVYRATYIVFHFGKLFKAFYIWRCQCVLVIIIPFVHRASNLFCNSESYCPQLTDLVAIAQNIVFNLNPCLIHGRNSLQVRLPSLLYF